MQRLTIWLLIALCGLCLFGCGDTPAESSDFETETTEESAEEESLPEKEALVLLYEYYIRASTVQDGFTYEYTYCIDDEGAVFNAEAVIVFPAEKDAEAEYKKLLLAGYPNLELNGRALSFAFPRKECPYFGISYTALPYLLEDSVYTVTDAVLPEKDEISDEGFDTFF